MLYFNDKIIHTEGNYNHLIIKSIKDQLYGLIRQEKKKKGNHKIDLSCNWEIGTTAIR